jgi:hypothetical protein
MEMMVPAGEPFVVSCWLLTAADEARIRVRLSRNDRHFAPTVGGLAESGGPEASIRLRKVPDCSF